MFILGNGCVCHFMMKFPALLDLSGNTSIELVNIFLKLWVFRAKMNKKVILQCHAPKFSLKYASILEI